MSVWSRLNGVAGNIRSGIGQLAAEVLEAVDEVRKEAFRRKKVMSCKWL